MNTAQPAQNPDFEEDPPKQDGAAQDTHFADAFLLNLDGYEGPIEVLLDLARSQKLDLRKISILQLTRQYLGFVERAKQLHLDLAAEYLVMAAWLAYLKSRLLVPAEKEEDEPDAEAMAEALQLQLRRLEAMQERAEALKDRPQLGQDFFKRGAAEVLSVTHNVSWDADLYELLRAYGEIRRRKDNQQYDLPIFNLMSAEEAYKRVARMLGALPKAGPHSAWTTLESFLPEEIKDKQYGRSALASLFLAGLEMAKEGALEIRQEGLFRTIYMRTLGGQKHESKSE